MKLKQLRKYKLAEDESQTQSITSFCRGKTRRASFLFSHSGEIFLSMKNHDLVEIALENVEFFNKNENQKFCQTFQVIVNTIENLQVIVNEIESFAVDYDFSEASPGNGYRSFVYVYETAVKRAKDICILIQKNRGSILFRKIFYEK